MSNYKTQRSRLTREQWQVLIDNFNANPIDPPTYCKQVGVTMDRFNIWQRRFEQSGFIEVKPAQVMDLSSAPTNDTSGASSHWDIELSLGDEITLRMRTR